MAGYPRWGGGGGEGGQRAASFIIAVRSVRRCEADVSEANEVRYGHAFPEVWEGLGSRRAEKRAPAYIGEDGAALA